MHVKMGISTFNTTLIGHALLTMLRIQAPEENG